MIRIAFLRHGPTHWNEQGRIQGHTDIPLSPEGLARMTMRRPPPPFDDARLYVSPLTRARQTAQALGLGAGMIDARLMEQNWGRWEGLTRAEILARDGEEAFIHAGLAARFRPPGGESTQELMDRVGAFLADAARETGDAVAVAHLGVLRAAYTLATGWDMATPMPEALDVSKALILSLDGAGRPAIQALNVDLPVKA
jgi:probable phosphoglycerate mutase